MKPIVTIILVLIFILSSVDTFAADTNTTSISYRVAAFKEKLSTMTQADIDIALSKFSDMDKHWSRPYVGRLTSLEILKGMPDGSFMPDKEMKVDEFVAMTVRALGFKPEMGDKYWAEPYIKIAKDEKLIQKNEFPTYSRPILRQEAARLAVRAVMLSETAPNSSIYDYIRGKIKDYPSIADDCKQYVLQAYAMGLINGTSKGFLPKKSLTRGEASTITIKQLDVSLRTPLKPDVDEVLVIKDFSGKSYEVYPTSVRETFDTAIALKNCIGKSKGYSFMVYNPFDQIISGSFYTNEDVFKKSNYNIDMGFSIYSQNYENIDHPYEITVFKPEKTKELHRAAIVQLFDSLFGSDSSKAIAQFDKYLGLSMKNGPAVETAVNYNGRKTRFYKLENDMRFSVWIYLKK